MKLLPKTLLVLPNGVALLECILYGFEGVPNDGCGKCNFDVGLIATGDVSKLKPGGNFLQGVSGMPGRPGGAGMSSGFRCRFEIKPVDMNGTGLGFTFLKASGVATPRSSVKFCMPLKLRGLGRSAPIGKDFVKSILGKAGLWKSASSFFFVGASCMGLGAIGLSA